VVYVEIVPELVEAIKEQKRIGALEKKLAEIR